MKWLFRLSVLIVPLALLSILPVSVPTAASQDGENSFRARLNGYQETPASISTRGRGEFRARLVNQNTLQFELEYSNLEGGAVSAAHIHFGQRATGGGVSAFLCGGAKPACPPSGTVTGTVLAVDVIGPAGQGIAAGEFQELLRAMRVGATYVNVHTATWPSGEIRGQINDRRGDD